MKHNTLPKTSPLGRLDELRSRPEAELIAFIPGRGLFSEHLLRKFRTRRTMEVFLNKTEGWNALMN